MDRIRRRTVLEQRRSCDLRSLSLGAVDAFVLTLVDGRLTAAEIADIQGAPMVETFRVLDRLLAAGAIGVVGEPTPLEAKPAAKPAPPPKATRAPPARRASSSMRAPPSTHTPLSKRPPRATRAPPPKPTVAPPKPGPSPKPTPAPKLTPPPKSKRPAGRSTASMRARSDAPATRRRGRSGTLAAPPPVDPVVVARILAFDASLTAVSDHYAALAVPRTAEKTAIKRAYFALAAEFHPDKHFGKDLGAAAPALQRIFVRLTKAYDTLANRTARAEYDATLEPLPPPAQAPPASPPSPPSPPVAPPPPPSPPSAPVAPPPAPSGPAVATRVFSREAPAISEAKPKPSASGTGLRFSPASPANAPAPSASGARVRSDEPLFRLFQSARRDETHKRVALFVQIAEDALGRDDLVTAAHHFRLALQNEDDPVVRAKLTAIEGEAALRIERRAAIRNRESKG